MHLKQGNGTFVPTMFAAQVLVGSYMTRACIQRAYGTQQRPSLRTASVGGKELLHLRLKRGRNGLQQLRHNLQHLQVMLVVVFSNSSHHARCLVDHMQRQRCLR